jgi:hypothetical protein
MIVCALLIVMHIKILFNVNAQLKNIKNLKYSLFMKSYDILYVIYFTTLILTGKLLTLGCFILVIAIGHTLVVRYDRKLVMIATNVALLVINLFNEVKDVRF